MKKMAYILLVTALSVTTAGCITMPQPMTAQHRRLIESRDLNGSYDNAYRATLTILQDKGYTITTSDFQGGVIRAFSGNAPANRVFIPDIFYPEDPGHNTSDITITLMKRTDTVTNVRIGIMRYVYDADGKLTKRYRVDNSEAFREYFADIQKELFIREQLERS